MPLRGIGCVPLAAASCISTVAASGPGARPRRGARRGRLLGCGLGTSRRPLLVAGVGFGFVLFLAFEDDGQPELGSVAAAESDDGDEDDGGGEDDVADVHIVIVSPGAGPPGPAWLMRMRAAKMTAVSLL